MTSRGASFYINLILLNAPFRSAVSYTHLDVYKRQLLYREYFSTQVFSWVWRSLIAAVSFSLNTIVVTSFLIFFYAGIIGKKFRNYTQYLFSGWQMRADASIMALIGAEHRLWREEVRISGTNRKQPADERCTESLLRIHPRASHPICMTVLFAAMR